MADSVTYVINLRDKASANLKKISNNTKNADSSFKRMGGTLAKLVGPALLGLSFSKAIINAVKTMTEFEKQMSNLSAITGATGADLDFLKGKAIEMAGATTKSAGETAEAMKLIASAKPDLLTNASALAEVTRQAITLSEASGLDLTTAATNLTDVLNQFNLTAGESTRVINSLAAGSKFSAAEVPDVSTAIKEFGVNAKDANISVEQSIALVETLAEKGVKGQRAGIQLRNILLKLAASTDKTINPEFVSLTEALDNLGKQNLSTAELTKMFGRQNVVAAKTIIQNTKRVNELTAAVTGTNTAYEQARINVDNLSGDVSGLSSAWEKFVLNLNKGDGIITSTLRNFTQNLTSVVNWLDKLNTSAENLGKNDATALFARSMGKTFEALKPAEQIAWLNTDLKDAEENLNRLKRKGKPSLLNAGPFGLFAKQKEWKRQIAKNEEFILNAGQYIKSISETGKIPGAPKLTNTPITPPATMDKNLEQGIRTITGAAPKTFNINIESLIENFEISTTNLKESTTEVKKAITIALSEALADVEPIRT